MTQHRLVHCTVQELLARAARRHRLDDASARSAGRRWFAHGDPPGGAAVRWSTTVPGPQHTRVVCWLEVEPGATGVLAHLTLVAEDSTWPVPPPLSSLALRAWSGRELAALAREAETPYAA